jgi:CBS domain-containing protein
MTPKSAAEIMTRTVVTVSPDTPLTKVIELLIRHSISATPVVDDANTLVGIISEIDLINFALSGEAGNSLVSDAMTREVIAFPPDAPCPAIANCFAQKRLRRVPIVENGKLVGLVSRRDILRQMLILYNTPK